MSEIFMVLFYFPKNLGEWTSLNYRERWLNICMLKVLSPSSRWVQITIDDICFDVLGSKFGYVQGLDHSEVINTFTQHNLYRGHYN